MVAVLLVVPLFVVVMCVCVVMFVMLWWVNDTFAVVLYCIMYW